MSYVITGRPGSIGFWIRMKREVEICEAMRAFYRGSALWSRYWSEANWAADEAFGRLTDEQQQWLVNRRNLEVLR